MTEEIWKDIPGYEGLYQVSNTGLIRSLDRFVGNRNRIKGKILSINIKKGGYCSVVLSKYGKMKGYQVHRLVAEAFIPNLDNLPFVNHKDENKTNNCIENLEWCDSKYNNNYGTKIERMINTNVNNGVWNPDMVGLDRKTYMKIYRKEHKEEIREYNNKYNESWDKKAYMKIYRENHREELREYKRMWRKIHKEKINNEMD